MRGYWNETFTDSFVLLDEQGRQIATLSKYDWGYSDTLWKLEFFFNRVSLYAENGDIAKWKATNEMINLCNEEIGKFSKIRDHLPSIHELAERAGAI